MMRDMDETVKRWLRANKPAPTAEFSNSVRKALTMLPEQKKEPELRLLPASIIVFAAVALVCLAVLNHEAIWALFSDGTAGHSTHGNIAANGAATPSPSKGSGILPATTEPSLTPSPSTSGSDETPAPTTETTGAPQPETTAAAPDCTATPGPDDGTPLPAVDDKYLQSINVSATDKGITEKVIKAGSDGFMLYMEIEVGPFAKGINPQTNHKVTINGDSNEINYFPQLDTSVHHEGYFTYDVRMPLLKSLESGTAHIQVTDTIKKYLLKDGSIKVLATCSYSFDLEINRPDKLNATGDGTILYGNQAHLEGLYESGMGATLVFSVEDNQAGELEKYFNKHIKDRGNSQNQVMFEGDYPKIMDIVICKGLVDKKILKELYTPAEGKDAEKAYNDLYGKVLIKYTNMILEKNASGQFRLYITNMNTVFPLQPTDDITLFSCSYDANDADPSKSILDYATYYILHIKVN